MKILRVWKIGDYMLWQKYKLILVIFKGRLVECFNYICYLVLKFYFWDYFKETMIYFKFKYEVYFLKNINNKKV